MNYRTNASMLMFRKKKKKKNRSKFKQRNVVRFRVKTDDATKNPKGKKIEKRKNFEARVHGICGELFSLGASFFYIIDIF